MSRPRRSRPRSGNRGRPTRPARAGRAERSSAAPLGPRGCARSRGSARPPRSGRSRVPGRSASSADGRSATARPRPVTPIPVPSESGRPSAWSMRIPRIRSIWPSRSDDRRAFRGAPADIDHSGMERPAADLQDQLGAATAGPFGPLGIERPLEPEARRAEQAQSTRGPTHRHRIELRRLDQDVGRVVGRSRSRAHP